MKQVWICDFCRNTEEDKERMELHEKDCCANPRFSNCYSCKSYATTYNFGDWFGTGGYQCDKGIQVNVMLEVQSDVLSCSKWEKK